MRILLGLESYLPNISGVVIFTKRLATYLAANGHEVKILTTSPSSEPYEKKDPTNFSVQGLRGWKNPFRGGLRLSYPGDEKEIKKILADFSPDIIHLQDPGPLSKMIRREAGLAKIPVIIHHHFSMEFVLSYVRPHFLAPLIKPFIRRSITKFYNSCDKVITPTEYVRKIILKWGVKTPVIALSNGTELKRFTPGKPEEDFYNRYEINRRDKIILYTGRLDKDKNIWTLLRAIPKILAQKPETKFIFVGEGTERKKMDKWLIHFDLNKKVLITGFISHDDPALPKFYQAAYILWTASTIETQSITTLEGMATGLPVVAANAGALPELIHNDENGYLIPPFDANAFATAVLKILNSPELAEKFSKKSIEVASGHDVEKSLKKLENIYTELIDSKCKVQISK